MIKYTPTLIRKPSVLINAPSAWIGLESIIEDILLRFGINIISALEFGVDYGYSTVALSNFFDTVIGVDTFEGDIHAGHRENAFDTALKNVSIANNIILVKSDYRDFIKETKEYFDLIHIDIVHTYKETFECGLWAVNNSSITIFHDTEMFPEVRQAVIDIAKETGKECYNYEACYGLGIIV